MSTTNLGLSQPQGTDPFNPLVTTNSDNALIDQFAGQTESRLATLESGSSSGTVRSVTIPSSGETLVSVDNTDPDNPIVQSTTALRNAAQAAGTALQPIDILDDDTLGGGVDDGTGNIIPGTPSTTNAPSQSSVKNYVDGEIETINEALDDIVQQLNNMQERVTIFGVRIDTTNPDPEAAVVYTDDAQGFMAASGGNGNYIAGSMDSIYPFNAIKPCLFKDGTVVGYLNPSDFTQWENNIAPDGQPSNPDITTGAGGDVMIEIPHFFYSIGHVGNFLDVRLSQNQFGGATDFAFSYNGTVRDKFYIGAYLGHNDGTSLRSISGVVPTGSTTIGNFRLAAQANGNGYEQLPFNKLTALQILYLLQFKNLNSQAALGQGYTNASAYRNTGATNTNGMNYGTDTTAAATDTVKFQGIEDFWGNLFQRIDGVIGNGIVAGTGVIGIADGGFNDTGAGYTAFPAVMPLTASPSYTKDVIGNNNLAFVPSAIGGSNSTFYSDNGYVSGTANRFVRSGGSNSSAGDAGAFYFRLDLLVDDVSSGIGARLCYCG